MKRLDPTAYKRRPSIYPVEIYVGQVELPHREIAVIDSSGYPDDDDATRVRQLEELRQRARGLGADAVQDVRLMTKRVRGYTIDERTPFPALKQGRYPLYFMRGTAIVYETSLPGAVAEGRGFTLPSQEELLPLPTPSPTPPPLPPLRSEP